MIDYYFFYGPNLDKVIAAYRELTGQAPLFGKWAYGFWQCKNRYKSQAEILGVARKYRELHIPADNIVQDSNTSVLAARASFVILENIVRSVRLEAGVPAAEGLPPTGPLLPAFDRSDTHCSVSMN